ncbi:CLIP domain-containing serine protease HP8-like [Panulirus ornatus]|uniref:CLIP domain-containing serine protease HP8-like n=1 Tax=Panulirus ornatus TaxID=150431 RepID=UPI003A8C1CE5
MGWAFTETGPESDMMLYGVVALADRETCNATYRGNLVDEEVCFGGKAGQGFCTGGSGTSLVMLKASDILAIQTGVGSYGPAPYRLHLCLAL